jgi:uncharacterized protein
MDQTSPGTEHGGELDIRHAEAGGRGAFYVEQGGSRVAELTYSRASPGRVIVEHTEVSDTLRGQGVAKKLVLAAVEWARSTGTKIVPTCPYARSVIERDASLQDVCGAAP